MTAAELIENALETATNRPVHVRKAALLWISRVQAVVAPSEAVSTMEAGLEISNRTHEGEGVGFEYLSRVTIAAVSPERLTRFAITPRGAFHSKTDELASVMWAHGHFDYLRTYVFRDAPLGEVPLQGINMLLNTTEDRDQQRQLILRAFESWRVAEPQAPDRFTAGDALAIMLRNFGHCFSDAEVKELLTELVDVQIRKPDVGVSGRVNDVTFSSTHSLVLFHLVDLLLRFDPERVGQFICQYPELATALKRYPKGFASIHEESEAQRANAASCEPGKSGRFILFGSQDELDHAMALMQAETSEDFSKPLADAEEQYRRDSLHRNRAPKAFWPSSAMYRRIFYTMGKSHGEKAEARLRVIADEDLRLFAQIELAAALAGLTELPDVRIGAG